MNTGVNWKAGLGVLGIMVLWSLLAALGTSIMRETCTEGRVNLWGEVLCPNGAIDMAYVSGFLNSWVCLALGVGCGVLTVRLLQKKAPQRGWIWGMVIGLVGYWGVMMLIMTQLWALPPAWMTTPILLLGEYGFLKVFWGSVI